jgi:excinuclease ABC subunit B
VSNYRREKQLAYNKEHNITPRTVTRAVEDSLAVYQNTRKRADMVLREGSADFDVTQTIAQLQQEMVEAADNLQFEKAALMRDQIRELKQSLGEPTMKPQSKVSYRKQKRSAVRP